VSVLDTVPSNGGLTRACFPFVRLLRGIVMALASGPAGHSTVCSPQIISRSQCTGMRPVGLVVDLVHVGSCTTVDIGFDVGGRRGRCGGTICRMYYDQRDSSMGSGLIVGCADGYVGGSRQ
jgi:hypothetical protein